MRRTFGSALLLLLGLMPLLAAEGQPAGANAPPSLNADSAWTLSTDNGATWSAGPFVVPGGKAATCMVRAVFTVPNPQACAFWELAHRFAPTQLKNCKVNEQAVAMPLPGMRYRSIPGIPAKALNAGQNTVTLTLAVDNRQPRGAADQPRPDVSLDVPAERATLAGQTLAFKTGPTLGAFSNEYFSVTCRTTVPAPAKLFVAFAGGANPEAANAAPAEVAASPDGFIHRFKVKLPQGTSGFKYYLEASLGDARAVTKTAEVRIPKWVWSKNADEVVRLVMAGDCRSRPEEWSQVAAAMLREKPDLVVFSGDMLDCGLNDWEWDEHFFGPASVRELLATIPFYAVQGNHEESAPLFNELFFVPGEDGRANYWSQRFGSAEVIGIKLMWTADWERTILKWLKNTLSASDASFIFLVEHFPAWSSGGQGKVDEKTGESRQWSCRTARSDLIPLMAKHKATALIVGHEHGYERSETPQGITQIISAGAGAPQAPKSKDAQRQNPHSTKFVMALNYCLFEIKGEDCTLTAKTPDEKVLDTRSWKKR